MTDIRPFTLYLREPNGKTIRVNVELYHQGKIVPGLIGVQQSGAINSRSGEMVEGAFFVELLSDLGVHVTMEVPADLVEKVHLDQDMFMPSEVWRGGQ